MDADEHGFFPGSAGVFACVWNPGASGSPLEHVLELRKFQAVSRPSCRFAFADLSGAEEDGGQEQDRAGRDEQDAQAGVSLVELNSTEEKAQRNEESCCTETARSPVA